ncbi:cell shape determination protein CcmA, partial [Candidatus Shapirobacteria bacterium CG11_big_fil_rev_8_21_14_0_20_40_12]
IDGIVNGNIKTNGNLKVGESAKITASVHAHNALISGEINGNVIIEGDLEMTTNAKIFGDIEVKSLSMARGAILNGKCVMKQNNQTTTDEQK